MMKIQTFNKINKIDDDTQKSTPAFFDDIYVQVKTVSSSGRKNETLGTRRFQMTVEHGSSCN
jgi:hypothetical protein